MGKLSRDNRRDLLKLLAVIGILRERAGRNLLLKDLPQSLVDKITRSDNTTLDLNSIVDSCDTWEPLAADTHPLKLMIENACDLVQSGQTEIDLQQLCDKIFQTENPPTLPTTVQHQKRITWLLSGVLHVVSPLYITNVHFISAAYSPDGEHIVTASRDGTARVWDVNTGQELSILQQDNQTHTHHLPTHLSDAAYSPDGRHIITVAYGGLNYTAHVWDATANQELVTLRGHTNLVHSAVYSPDGQRIVTASHDRTARVWDANTGQELVTVRHNGYVASAAYSPNGQHIVTASQDGTARVWDAATGRVLAAMTNSAGPLHSAAFSPDGQHIIITGNYENETARVWDTVTGLEHAIPNSYTSKTVSASYSADGQLIITTANFDYATDAVYIWDATTGQEIAALRGHTGYVASAAFSPVGWNLVTASMDGTARIYSAVLGRLTD